MSSAGDPRSEASILERNLQLLLTRAYVPIEPSAAFRARLERMLRLEIEARARRSAGSSGAHVIDRSETASRTGSLSAKRAAAAVRWPALSGATARWTLRAAAAIVCVALGIFGWKLVSRGAPEESRAARLERIAAAGRTAIATDAASAVRALSDEEVAQGLEYGGPELAVWTAPKSDLTVWLGSGARSDGRLRVQPSTHVQLAGEPDAAPGTDVALSLDLPTGAIELERYATGNTWRIRTREGDLELERGALLVSVGSTGAAGRVSARLRSGSAFVASNGERRVLPLDVDTEIRSGRVVVAEPPDVGGEVSERTPLASSDPAAEDSTPTPAPKPRGALHGVVSCADGSTLPERYSITLLRDERLPNVAQPQDHAIDGGQREFTLSDLRPGTYTVFAEARGFAVWQRRGVQVRAGGTIAEIAIELARGHRVSGRVVDADTGRPIEGAVVISQLDAPAQVLPLDLAQLPEGWIAAATSGPDGRFELEALSRGVHHLRATHAGYGAAWSEALDVRPDTAHDDVELRLGRGGAVFGHVAHKDGRAWSAAFIIAARIEFSFDMHVMSFGSAVSAADGTYAIEDLPAGSYVVLNANEPREEHVTSPHVTQANVKPGVRLEVDLGAVRRGTQLAGRIIAAPGRTTVGLDVIVEPRATPFRGRKWQSERARDDGTFRFVDLVPGTYDVYVSEEMGKNFVLQDEVEVPAVPELTYDLHLGTGEITGRVLDDSGQRGLPNSVVVIEVDRDGAHVFAGRVASDADGRYAVRHLPAGSYRVKAFAMTGRFGPEIREGLRVAAGETVSNVDVRLSPGAALEVRVVDAEGRPIEGAGVSVTDENGQRMQFTPEDLTDARGKFSINGIQPGRWNVSATYGGSRPAARTIELHVGLDEVVDIVLTPAAPR